VFTTANVKPRRGADVERTVVVTLQEAYTGTTRLVELASGRCFAVKIPPGVDTGTKVRYTGYGLSGHKGGSRGDLYLVIDVRSDPSFERRGDDLYHQREANLAELALGTEARIRTLDGRILGLTIPAGTLPGQRFRLAGEGTPQLHQPDQRGDLYVTVNAKIPPSLEKIRAGVRLRSQAPHEPTSHEDDIFVLLFLTVLFAAGIGAGLLLYWLIFG
jgi:curved DNA-binding protein